MRNRDAFLFCMTGSGGTVVADVAVMVSCRYGKNVALRMLVQTSTDSGDDSSPQCRCGFSIFTKRTQKARFHFISPYVFWVLFCCDGGIDCSWHYCQKHIAIHVLVRHSTGIGDVSSP